MNSRFIRHFFRTYKRMRKIKGYENIFNSCIEKIELVDPTAHIFDSKINGCVIIGNEVRLSNVYISGSVKIDSYTAIEGLSRIVSGLDKITIGKFCSIAPKVEILDTNHILDRASTYYIKSIIFGKDYTNDVVSKGDVNIGSDVWIGSQSIILPGVAIGHGSVIAANSVVTKSVAPYSVCAGSPARIIKYRFTPDIINKLLNLQWWLWSIETILMNEDFFTGSLTLDKIENVKNASKFSL